MLTVAGCVYTAGGGFECGASPLALNELAAVVEGFGPGPGFGPGVFPSPQKLQEEILASAAAARTSAADAAWLADGSMANASEGRDAAGATASQAQAHWQQVQQRNREAVGRKNGRVQAASSSAQSFVQREIAQARQFESSLQLQP